MPLSFEERKKVIDHVLEVKEKRKNIKNRNIQEESAHLLTVKIDTGRKSIAQDQRNTNNVKKKSIKDIEIDHIVDDE